MLLIKYQQIRYQKSEVNNKLPCRSKTLETKHCAWLIFTSILIDSQKTMHQGRRKSFKSHLDCEILKWQITLVHQLLVLTHRNTRPGCVIVI